MRNKQLPSVGVNESRHWFDLQARGITFRVTGISVNMKIEADRFIIDQMHCPCTASPWENSIFIIGEMQTLHEKLKIEY